MPKEKLEDKPKHTDPYHNASEPAEEVVQTVPGGKPADAAPASVVQPQAGGASWAMPGIPGGVPEEE